jgi:hypothetical protein
VTDTSLKAKVDEMGEPLLKEVLSIADKMDRQAKGGKPKTGLWMPFGRA